MLDSDSLRGIVQSGDGDGACVVRGNMICPAHPLPLSATDTDPFVSASHTATYAYLPETLMHSQPLTNTSSSTGAWHNSNPTPTSTLTAMYDNSDHPFRHPNGYPGKRRGAVTYVREAPHRRVYRVAHIMPSGRRLTQKIAQVSHHASSPRLDLVLFALYPSELWLKRSGCHEEAALSLSPALDYPPPMHLPQPHLGSASFAHFREQQ
ncbi:hypothetical protein BJ138DRAFT_1106302 [Hygrophoropsis aurantiaca]|uniref:Uncharacterized protein n=1 Tax=Hygrophoropsis aurantiaca TaxID=72124 RepID=A0ACB7ZV59_9AGAM|nr:hypothetical protein BJ138DRAFT_1106302 [Hygrophoropsis aurantiaca]